MYLTPCTACNEDINSYLILQVIKNEGWGGLYRGLTPSIIGTACSQVFPALLDITQFD